MQSNQTLVCLQNYGKVYYSRETFHSVMVWRNYYDTQVPSYTVKHIVHINKLTYLLFMRSITITKTDWKFKWFFSHVFGQTWMNQFTSYQSIKLISLKLFNLSMFFLFSLWNIIFLFSLIYMFTSLLKSHNVPSRESIFCCP